MAPVKAKRYTPQEKLQARKLYADGMSFSALSEKSGATAATLKRWAKAEGWSRETKPVKKAPANVPADTNMEAILLRKEQGLIREYGNGSDNPKILDEILKLRKLMRQTNPHEVFLKFAGALITAIINGGEPVLAEKVEPYLTQLAEEELE